MERDIASTRCDPWIVSLEAVSVPAPPCRTAIFQRAPQAESQQERSEFAGQFQAGQFAQIERQSLGLGGPSMYRIRNSLLPRSRSASMAMIVSRRLMRQVRAWLQHDLIESPTPWKGAGLSPVRRSLSLDRICQPSRISQPDVRPPI